MLLSGISMLINQLPRSTYFIYICLLATTLNIISLTGCSIYRMPIRQGVELEQLQLDKLKPGMSKQQVYDILGSTTLESANPYRLDYYFSNKINKPKQFISKHLILYFDKNQELTHYEGDFKLKYLPTTVLQNKILEQKS